MSKATEDVDEALNLLTEEVQKDVRRALDTPDMYPARNIAPVLKLPVSTIHAWRRERGIKKARS